MAALPPLIDAERLRRRFEALAQIGADPAGGVSGLAFAEAGWAARGWPRRELAGPGSRRRRPRPAR